jgi:ParB family chromosome partitioning protein
MIFGSSLWRIASDPQRADKREIAESLAASKSEAAFAAEREAVLDLLGLAGDGACVVRNGDDYRLAELFLSLLRRSDEEVLRILAFLMAETLQAGSCAVETLGVHLKVDMRSVWQPDETFFDLLRDKQGINAMLAHIGGDTAAQGNIAATAKTQKQIIRNFLSGKDRTKAEGWLPRYMEFPFVAYTQRGGGNLSDNAARVAELAP